MLKASRLFPLFLKTLVLVIGISAMSFYFSYVVFAWTEPTAVPPGANAPAPVNVSPTAQTKNGNLSVAALYDTNNASYFIDPASAVLSGAFAGPVTIGTTTPEFKLTLNNDGGIIAKGTFGSGAVLATTGAGARMIWYPNKAAFRAGRVDGAQWDNGSIGQDSFAGGRNSTANNTGSVAIGENTTASGQNSVALGAGTTASGGYSTAMGVSSRATAYGATALGAVNNAYGIGSTAIGYTVQANNYATALGAYTSADGYMSSAMGPYLTVGGRYSMVLGSGIDNGSGGIRLVNNIDNSLAVGFNSDTPTFFVGPSAGVGTTGNVGIGTASPNAMYKLDVAGRVQATQLTLNVGSDPMIPILVYTDGTSMFYFQSSAAGSGYISAGSGGVGKRGYLNLDDPDGFTIHNQDGDLVFATSSLERAIINSAGNVGIGTMAPSEKLEVNGNVKATSFITASDERLKDNIQAIEDPLGKIMKLNGVTFTWKSNGEKSDGVIAQNVETVFPELVKTDKASGMKAVEYSNLVAPLIEAVKEQQKMIENQQKEIDLLKAEVENKAR